MANNGTILPSRKIKKIKKDVNQDIVLPANENTVETIPITKESIDSKRPVFLQDRDFKLYQYIFSNESSKIPKTTYYYNDAIKLLYAFGGYRLIDCNNKNILLSERKHGSHIIIKLENPNKVSQTFLFVEGHKYLYKYEIDQLRTKLSKFGFTPDRIMLAG